MNKQDVPLEKNHIMYNLSEHFKVPTNEFTSLRTNMYNRQYIKMYNNNNIGLKFEIDGSVQNKVLFMLCKPDLKDSNTVLKKGDNQKDLHKTLMDLINKLWSYKYTTDEK